MTRLARLAAALVRPPAVTLAVGALLAGCGDDGRELRAPPPGATAPPLPSSSTTALGFNPPGGSQEPLGTLVLTSVAFLEGAAIPERFACTGENVSPPLSWTGVPAGTVELAITVTDLDAGGDASGPAGGADGFVHWIVAGLAPGLTALDEGADPEGSVQARNDSSELGWSGPCPPAGEVHRYRFTLHALSAPSGLGAGASGADAIALLAAVPGATATLTGTYPATGA